MIISGCGLISTPSNFGICERIPHQIGYRLAGTAQSEAMGTGDEGKEIEHGTVERASCARLTLPVVQYEARRADGRNRALRTPFMSYATWKRCGAESAEAGSFGSHFVPEKSKPFARRPAAGPALACPEQFQGEDMHLSL